jgi:hypothetical protein
MYTNIYMNIDTNTDLYLHAVGRYHHQICLFSSLLNGDKGPINKLSILFI